MTWTPVFAFGQALGVDGGTSGTFDSTGADTLFLGFGTDNSNAATLIDNKGNNWTLSKDFTSAFGKKCYLYRTDTPANVGAGHTVTVTDVGGKISIAIDGLAVGKTSSIDDQTNAAGSIFSQTLQPGSITPSEDNTVVITVIMATDDNREPTTIDGGFTVAASVEATAGNNSLNVGIAHLIQTSAAAANPTWTLANGSAVHENAVIGNFKTTAAASDTLAPQQTFFM